MENPDHEDVPAWVFLVISAAYFIFLAFSFATFLLLGDWLFG